VGMTNPTPFEMDHEWWAARLLPRFTDAELEKERTALERVLAVNPELRDVPIWLAAIRHMQVARTTGTATRPDAESSEARPQANEVAFRIM
jgi:hypothetical protein